jgi:hypothetical protein
MNLPSLKVLPQFELPQPMQQLQKHIQDHWINAIKTITVAPAPPDTKPGLPPKTAVTNPMMKAAYSPTKGGKPAKIANDNDSESWSWQQLLKFRFYNLLLSEVK